MQKGKIRVCSTFLAALLLFSMILPAAAASATAATMRLAQYTGTVNVTNSSGRTLSKRDNMLLYSGYQVETQAKSYAWISLDDTKLAKLDALSKVEVRKSGKKLEVLLKSGNIFFNVTKPLDSDETLNIRTSTMIVGIRGTSGYIQTVDRWTAIISVLEGTLECTVTDPVTGQTETATIENGETAIATVYPQEQEGDKCDIIQERLKPADIGGYVLEELAQDPGLCGDIFDKSGLDVLPPMGILESARRQLDGISKELEDIREQLEGQDPSVGDLQNRLDDLQQRLEAVKKQLEQAGPDAGARRRLDEAQEHLEQAREALNGDNIQDALDRLDDARDDLEGTQQAQAAGAQQQAQAAARERMEQTEREMQDMLDRIEDELAEQDNNVSAEPVWEQQTPNTPDIPDIPTTPEPEPENVTYRVSSASELLAALNSANAGDTIILAANISVSSSLGLSSGSTNDPVIFDLNGHSLTMTGNSDFNITGALDIRDSGSGGAVNTDGTVRTQGSGYLHLSSGAITGGSDYTTCVSAVGHSTVVMDGGTVTGRSGNSQAVYVGEGSVFTMNAGTITNTGSGYAVNVVDSIFTMGAGTVSGGSNRAINCKNSTVRITGGLVTSSNSFATVYNSGGSVTYSAGTVTNTGSGAPLYNE